jgi:subtilase family serine protease
MWLARPADEGTPLANLDVEASACRDGTRIALRAANRGAADAEDVRYRVFEGSHLVAEDSLGRIDAGSAVAGVVLDDLPGHAELSVVIDPDNLVDECDEANNTVVVSLPY